jgi:hypothetical protein
MKLKLSACYSGSSIFCQCDGAQNVHSTHTYTLRLLRSIIRVW